MTTNYVSGKPNRYSTWYLEKRRKHPSATHFDLKHTRNEKPINTITIRHTETMAI